MTKTLCSRAGLAIAVLLLAACTTAPVAPPSPAALEHLLTVAGAEFSRVVESPTDSASFLGLSPAMDTFVQRVAPPEASAAQRLEALFDAFRYSHTIDYEDHATLTAAEAFRQQRANCLSFSAMFIAVARAAGLDARFQEVDVPPIWDSGDTQTLIQYRHVNVIVRLGRGREAVIDLRPDRYSESYPRRVLTDTQAQAHYYSNLSMDQLIAGDLADAQRLAYRALLADQGQSFVWNNMGIIQRRQGELDLAETSYRQALSLNGQDWSAMSNLAYIFERHGQPGEAARLRALSDQTKLRNPYYRYALAVRAYNRGDFHTAVQQLDQAIQHHQSEARFFYLRGMSHWQLGADGLAMIEMRKAIERATDTNSQANYQHQLAEWQGLEPKPNSAD